MNEPVITYALLCNHKNCNNEKMREMFNHEKISTV